MNSNSLRLWDFWQFEDPYEMYDEFTVIAKSKEEAWTMITNKFKGTAHEDMFINDLSKYEIESYPLNKPVLLCHSSAG